MHEVSRFQVGEAVVTLEGLGFEVPAGPSGTGVCPLPNRYMETEAGRRALSHRGRPRRHPRNDG